MWLIRASASTVENACSDVNQMTQIVSAKRAHRKKGEAVCFALEWPYVNRLAHVDHNYFLVYFAVPLSAQVLPLSTEYSIFQSNVVGVWLNAVIRLSIVIPIILSSPCRTV